MAAQLSVNLNAIAMLRNRRDLPWPSMTGLGRIALEAGAAGLTVHPRPDERHTRRSDVPALLALVRADFPDREFNIEGFPDARFMEIVEAARPDQVTLVPDDPAQSTSDHGWDIAANRTLLAEIRTNQLRAELEGRAANPPANPLASPPANPLANPPDGHGAPGGR